MPKDLVSNRIPEEQYSAIKQQIADLRTAMPFLIDLTPEDKSRMVRAGESNMAFARLILDLAAEHGGIMPHAVDFNAFEQDIALYDQLKLL